LSKRGAHNRRKQNHTKLGANFSRHRSFAWRDRSLTKHTRWQVHEAWMAVSLGDTDIQESRCRVL
jgi:hypothetical protein